VGLCGIQRVKNEAKSKVKVKSAISPVIYMPCGSSRHAALAKVISTLLHVEALRLVIMICRSSHDASTSPHIPVLARL
jgi:hypothetical protein